jgi:carbamoyl-phosphate synthase large subunit
MQQPSELEEICQSGLEASRVHQCLIERGIAGWKEIEFEVIRDHTGKKLSICDMENIDPVGIHTGDSIVVAPCQSLSKAELSMLREAALRVIDALDIAGGCNVRFALKPGSMDYYIIEVNPCLSRSSALASKATAYPIARVATKIAVGYTLDEISFGQECQRVYASFEPKADYAALKIPRWPFDKFVAADKRLGTKMKATGEIMAIGATFEEAFMKALRSLELGLDSLREDVMKYWTDEELIHYIKRQEDKRIFAVNEALGRGMGVELLHELTKIDKWFLFRLEKLVMLEDDIRLNGLNEEKLKFAKRVGFADSALGRLCEMDACDIRAWRKRLGVVPAFVKVVTSAEGPIGEYYYSTYNKRPEPMKPLKNNVTVLGAGPIRIGQGIEFDYCSVHAVWALKRTGKSAVIINNNPETVSTDFDTADRLYFEPLTPEDVWNVLEIEQPESVVVQFGGQTAIKLAKPVSEMGYRILGTSLGHIDAAEDRERFDSLVQDLGIARPRGATVYTEKEALAAAAKIGYPVLVRPSYVSAARACVLPMTTRISANTCAWRI